MVEQDLGRRLVKAGMLSDAQLKTAVDYQSGLGGDLGAILVKLGFVGDDDLARFLSDHQGVPVADLEEVTISDDVLQLLPRKVVEKRLVLPLSRDGDVLHVAVADPENVEALEEIQFLTGCQVDVALAPRDAIHKAINTWYHHDGEERRRERERRRAAVAASGDDRADTDGDAGGDAAGHAGTPDGALLEALVDALAAKGVVDPADLHATAEKLRNAR